MRSEYDGGEVRVTRSAVEGLFISGLLCASLPAVGNVATHTTFNAELITYAYDALNRVTTKRLPNEIVTTTYTPTGQVATVSDNRGTTSYTYDARDRVTQVTLPEGWTLGYTYDAAGNRATVSSQYGTEAAKTTAYVYDSANRLAKVTSAEGEVTTFTYDAAGNRATEVLPNGTNIAWTYDARNRITKIAHRLTSTNAEVATYTYAWNGQGLRASEISTVAGGAPCEVDYSYDKLARLTQAVRLAGCTAPGTVAYSYDAVGNRISDGTSTYSYDVNDRLLTVGSSATYTYDNSGNVTQRTLTSGTANTVTALRWNAENRLTGATLPDSTQIAYTYDSDGELMREVRGTDGAASGITLYLADKNLPFSQVLEERDGSGNVKVAYEFADTQPIKQVRGGASSFYHSDHLSVNLVTGSNGAILNSYAYSPFGEIIAQSGATANEHLFAGERFNSDLALYYLRTRHLDPRLDRFVTADTFAGWVDRPFSIHRYLYGNADAINVTDPLGYMGLDETVVVEEIQATMQTGATASYRVVLRKTGCFAIEALAGEALNAGIYIFLDGLTDLPYVGQTSVDFNKRLLQHVDEEKRVVKQVMAQFHVEEKIQGEVLRKLEQVIIDLFGTPGGRKGKGTLSNDINALNKAKRKLMEGISQICK